MTRWCWTNYLLNVMSKSGFSKNQFISMISYGANAMYYASLAIRLAPTFANGVLRWQWGKCNQANQFAWQPHCAHESKLREPNKVQVRPSVCCGATVLWLGSHISSFISTLHMYTIYFNLPRLSCNAQANKQTFRSSWLYIYDSWDTHLLGIALANGWVATTLMLHCYME